ncbi:Hypothetical predicted protein [Paramuricea clavata]|uniref:Integrase zinc-binding domain-containing protein n=1 Tax=Paramuricea clavata TaxID=317549 RepID=A0A6S7HU41_PARCT|nr:Hypothetical predicted protein [Paramuricea clavata]
MCEANLAWDGEFPETLTERWEEWYERFPERYTVPRTLAPNQQPILSVSLHAFGDASKDGVAAAVYAVIEQEHGITQGLVCSKSRIAKRNLTIPRLELCQDIWLQTCSEANEEIKHARSTQVLTTSSQPTDSDVFDKLIEKYPLRKVLRICAWIQRFARNCRTQPDNRDSGPLKTWEIKERDMWWIKGAQREAENSQEIEAIKRELNLQPNEMGILECRGRIEGEYPIYLPRDCTYTEKVIEQAHLATLHCGVGMTMANVRERFWVPKLRCLVKRMRSNCNGCVRFRTQAYNKPPPGNLPPTRTQGSTPFQVLGVDFAGPIRYQSKAKAEKKAFAPRPKRDAAAAATLRILQQAQSDSKES